MALKFYLGVQDSTHEIKVETNATFVKEIGVFDNGSFEIEWNQTKQAIFPRTKFIIYDTELDDSWVFTVLSDEVEVVQKSNPVRYKHHLIVSQNTNDWTAHILRNTIFTQPFNAKNECKLNVSGYCSVYTDPNGSGTSANQVEPVFYPNQEGPTQDIQFTEQTLVFTRETKVESAFIEVESMQQIFLKSIGQNVGDGNILGLSMSKTSGSPILTSLRQVVVRIEKVVNGSVAAYTDYTINKANNKEKAEIEVSAAFFSDATATYRLRLISALFYKVINDNNSLSWELSGTYVHGSDRVLDSGYYPMVFSCINLKLRTNVYYYSLYDVLDIVRKQYLKEYNFEASNLELYKMPIDTSSEVYQTLKNTIAPNFNFTGKDVFSVVSEILSYIDAIPTLSANGTLGYIYLNDQSREPIENLEMTDKKTNITQENFTNKLTTMYQNGRKNESDIYPAKNIFARVGSTRYGVPKSTDYVFTTPKQIDFIDEVTINGISAEVVLIRHGRNSNSAHIYGLRYNLTIPYIKIGTCVYDEDTYNLLPFGDGDDYSSPNKMNSFYYARGGKEIVVGNIENQAGNLQENVYYNVMKRGYTFALGIAHKTIKSHPDDPYDNRTSPLIDDWGSAPAKYNLQYNIVYNALYDGRVEQISIDNKYSGETYVNQSNANVSLNRMGNNMQGLIAKLGNEKRKISIPVTSYGSRLKVGSLWQDDDGNKYIANIVKTSFSTKSNKVIVEAEFSKNFNLISQFTSIDQEKRFYEISEKLTSKGYECITEYIYFSSQDPEDVLEQCNTVAFTNNLYRAVLNGLFNDFTTECKVDVVDFRSFEKETDVVATTGPIYIPSNCYGNGNGICFEVSYDSPINSINQLLGSSNLNNQPYLYAPSNGFADMVTVQGWCRIGGNVYAGEDFPYIYPLEHGELGGSVYKMFNIHRFKYYKKPNEIFHLNYQVAFLPFFTKVENELHQDVYQYEEFFFGDVFINQNPVLAGVDAYYRKSIHLWVSNTKYSIVDKKATGEDLGIADSSAYHYNETVDTYEKCYSVVDIDLNTTRSFKSWCLADNKGNILLACNKEHTNASQIHFVIFTSKRRLS